MFGNSPLSDFPIAGDEDAPPSFTVYEYIAFGGLIYGGVADVIESDSYEATGGATLGGAAGIARTINYLATGGAIFGGAADVIESDSYEATGGLLFGGVADVVRVAVHVATGGIVFTGDANVTESDSYEATGGIRLGGEADTEYEAGSEENEYIYVATGGARFGGAADVVESDTYAASGGLHFGGAALTSKTPYNYIAAGGVVFGGVAVTSYRRASVTGGIGHGAGTVFEHRGSFPTLDRYKPIPPTRAREYVYVASGGLRFGGEAACSLQTARVYQFIPYPTRRKYVRYNAACEFTIGCDPVFLLLAA